MSGIVLRPYQEDWIEGLRAAFRAGYHSPLGVLPTGAGKTVCFSYLTSRLVANGKRVVLMCHRQELVDQISRTLAQFDVRHGLITSGALYDRRLMTHVASVFALARRLDRTAVPDYVVCDEAHHCISDSTWGKVIAFWRQKNTNLKVIGVTATPQRLSGEGLGEVFDEMVLGPTIRELIDIGALSDYRLFSPAEQLDLSSVRTTAGEYNRKDLAGAMDKPSIVGSTVAEYARILKGAPAVAFCVSIEHAEHVAENFRAQGWKAASIDGKMDASLRRQMTQDFARGALNVLTSCQLIDEGYDCPGIVGVLDLSPTQSLARKMQRDGRAFRRFPGKDHAIILDQVNNTSRHGLPDDPREWSLAGMCGKRKKGEENVALRQCVPYENEHGRQVGGCYAVSPAAASKCRDCGAPFQIKSRTIEEVAGTLSEVDVARMKRQAIKDQAAARTLEDLIQLGISRGMAKPEGWARHLLRAREEKQRRASAMASMRP